jgi:uncharacterized OB-fold protein
MPGDERRFPAAVVDEAWSEGRLVHQTGPDGGALWPPRLAAPLTGDELTWSESAGRGTIYAATAIHARDVEPRSIVIVELDEGFRMMSRVEGIAAEDVRIGMRVRVRFTEPDETGARLPVFEPDEEGA